jgi:hypothetical protein
MREIFRRGFVRTGYSYSSGTYRHGLTKPYYNATCHEGTKCGEGYAVSN